MNLLKSLILVEWQSDGDFLFMDFLDHIIGCVSRQPNFYLLRHLAAAAK